MARWWLVISVALLPACKGKTQPAPAMSAGFHLELGSLYERYHEPKTAQDHFQLAVDQAENAAQSRQSRMSLARIKEAQGDSEGAISALEKAPAGDPEIVVQLGRLYAATGRYDDAERLYTTRLATETNPYWRDEILHLQVELLRKAGTLEKRIAERQPALEAKAPDEAELRFLALAWGGDALGMVMPPGRAEAPAPSLEKLTRVYERLRELHPGDPLIRQALIGLYERTSRVDDALALVRTSAAATAGAAGDTSPCPGGLISRPPTPAVTNAAEAIRLLVRASRSAEASAETAKLVARAGDQSIGVWAAIVGAQLYAEESKLDLAQAALENALRRARSADDKRALEASRADLYSRSGKAADLEALYARWKQSGDGCLKAEAERREPMLAQMPAPHPTRAMP